MALPTAQLGQMPSINLPNYVPGTQYKPTSPWVQALASMLANAGANAGDKLVGNELSRDNATEFGQKESTGWDRLLHGPQVDDRTALQLRGQAGDREKIAAEDQFGLEREAQRQAADEARVHEQERAATERSRGTNATSMANEATTLDRALAVSDATQAGEMERQRQLITANAPKSAADMAEATSRAKYYDAQTEAQRKSSALIPDPTKQVLDPSINANLIMNRLKLTEPTQVVGSDPRSYNQIVQDMTKRGATNDQVVAALQPGITKQNATQALVQSRIDAEKLAAQKQAAQEMLQRQLDYEKLKRLMYPNPQNPVNFNAGYQP